jgi:hypothetical protein
MKTPMDTNQPSKQLCNVSENFMFRDDDGIRCGSKREHGPIMNCPHAVDEVFLVTTIWFLIVSFILNKQLQLCKYCSPSGRGDERCWNPLRRVVLVSLSALYHL